jgi:hypothetical protein
VAAFFGEHRSLLRAVRRHGLRGLREARARRRLAGAVRRHAHDERERCHRAGVIEFASVAARTALYERIAERLEELDHPVAACGVGRLERLLAEPPPFRDYGPRARARNARIESILADLEIERAGRVRERNRAADGLPAIGRTRAAFQIERWRKAGK